MASEDAYIRQAAAIPIRKGRICLVTSRRNGKRWVIPKGAIEPDQSAGETALQEAWEEAGLTGTLEREPVGSYVYEKYGSVCHVTVFLMRVTNMAQDFPERDSRQRAWLSPSGVFKRVDDPGLAKILRAALSGARRRLVRA
jgi:8-oxo-dGTP pyrophosphatase MutT (NUDIX family)